MASTTRTGSAESPNEPKTTQLLLLTESTNKNCYATVALCKVEKVTDFSVAKDVTAIAVISKVVAPSMPQEHAADLYI